MKAPVLKFPGNPRPTIDRGKGHSATVIVLPIIPVLRFVSWRRRRKRKLTSVFVRGVS